MSDIIYKELIKDMTWSYSRIGCFKDCQYRWFLKYIRHESEEPMFYSSYGSYIHKLIEKYYKCQITKEELPIRFLLGFRDKVQGDRPSAAIAEKYLAAGLDYFKTFKPFNLNTISVEEKFEFELGDKKFVGFIDYLGEKDGEFWVIDNKSRALKPRSNRPKPTIKDKELDEMLRQLYIYSAAVEQKYGKFPTYLCFNCFRNGVFIKERFDKQKYEEAIQWALDNIAEIEETNDFIPNVEFFQCSYLCGLNEGCCYWQER